MEKIEIKQSKASSNESAKRSNRRTVNRRRQYKGGMVTYQDGHITLDCVVRDFSETGAKIHVIGSVTPPDQFTLKIELDGIWVDCEVIWRDEHYLGVKFLSEINRIPVTRLQVIENKQKHSVLKKN